MTTWFYGGYTHPANEVSLTRVERRNVYSRRDARIERVIRLHITLELLTQETDTTAAQADLNAKVQNLINIYDVEGQDCGFRLDDGTLTPHGIVSANTVNGTHVLWRDWPKGESGEYATRRTARLVLEGTFSAPDDQIVEFEQTVRYIGGGGQRLDVQETRGGAALTEQLNTFTGITIIQEGSGIGYQGYIDPLNYPPLFNTAIEDNALRLQNFDDPRQRGNVWTHFPSRWRYVFRSDVPVALLPPPPV